MSIYSLGEACTPTIAADAWVAPDAKVIGRVTLGARSSVWFGSVIRAENDTIDIGEGTNIQEHCTLHIDPGFPMTLARNVTIGHKVMLHGCTVKEQSLIGMGAILLNGSVIGRQSLVGAGTLIPEGKEYPDGVLIVGTPGRVVRELTQQQKDDLLRAAEHYTTNAARFRNELKQLDC
jgi:carbonic anhydrase/acetyltransferase-like protein (isoleucine patch superfamily)